MRAHLQELMKKNKIDWAIVSGDIICNPALAYLIPKIRMFSTTIVIPQDGKPFIFYNDMERDSAFKSGFKPVNYRELNLMKLYKNIKEPWERIYVFLREMINFLKISGRIGLYVTGDVGSYYYALNRLVKEFSNIEIVNDYKSNIFEIARLTKDDEEITLIKNIGKRTTKVFSEVEKYLMSFYIKDGIIVDNLGKPVTVGRVKDFIFKVSAEYKLISGKETIFSQGKEAGVPHNCGTNELVLRANVPIVFDYFPRDYETPYFFDMTRTYCPGEASDFLIENYKLVEKVLKTAISNIKVGQPIKKVGELACMLFESKGHPTILSNPDTIKGFVHSLGHGVGVRVHEHPSISHNQDEKVTFKEGMVFTIEPGLYYPEDDWGIRLEDIVAINYKGEVENLTNYPYNFVLPLKKY